MTFLLRDFFKFLILIFLGGLFVIAEVLLQRKKNDIQKTEIIRSVRFIFCLGAIFFFTLATILLGESLRDLSSHFYFLERYLFLLLTAFLMTLLISFFGIILPRFFKEVHPASTSIDFLSQLSWQFTSWMNPLVPFFDFVITKIFKLFGLSLRETHPASNEEVIHMMDEGLHRGVFNASEREMVEGVLELDEQTASSLMTPRSHVIFLNLDDEDEKNWRRIISSGHSEFPVFQGNQDNITGVVSVKALWANLSMAGSAKLSDLLMPPLYVFPHMTASKIIEEFRAKKHHTALVVDEFGVIEGIITLKDVIESILGMLPEREVKGHYPEIKKQEDGSWLVDAMINYEEVREKLDLPVHAEGEENRYQTLNGFFLHHLGHIPQIGESIVIENFRLQVFSMNHHRIGKLLISKV